MAVYHRNTSSVKSNKFDRTFFINTFIIFLFAFFLRIFASIELANGAPEAVFHPSTLTDMATYMKLASTSVEGAYYFQPFYYAVFLPTIHFLFGQSTWAVIIVQAILGALTASLCVIVGRLCFSRRCGYIAGILIAMSSALIFYTPFHLIATLQAFFLCAIVTSLLSHIKYRGYKWIILCGVLFGSSILTRGNIWLLLPLPLVFLWLTNSKFSCRLKYISVFLFPLILVIAPFVIRNSLKNSYLTGPSTASSQVLALGNSKEAPPGGRNPELPAGPMEYPEAYEKMMAKERQDCSVPEQIFAFFKEEPLAFIELQFRKLLLFWDGREIPNNVSLVGEGKHSVWVRYSIPTGVFLFLSIAGMLWISGHLSDLDATKKISIWVVISFIVFYWFATSAFYLLARFRVPVIPLTAIFAAYALSILFDFIRQHSIKLGYVAILLFSVWIVYFSYDFYRYNFEAVIMRLARPNGVVLSDGFENVYFDHGPETFGGWEFCPLKNGDTIEKKFAISPQDLSKPGVFEIIIVALKPTNIVVENDDGAPCNHKLKYGVNKIKLESNSTNQVEKIKIVVVAPDVVYSVFDTQRNWGRSSLNEAPLNGEWVSRLRIKKQ